MKGIIAFVAVLVAVLLATLGWGIWYAFAKHCTELTDGTRICYQWDGVNTKYTNE